MQLGRTMPHTLLAGQVLAMISIVPMIMYATWWQWLLGFVMYFNIVCLGISVGYHRLLSHRSFNCPKWLEYIFAWFGHIMMVGPAALWVATHREHHKYTDTDKDPHSPLHKGYFYAHFLQVYTFPRPRFMVDMLRNDVYKLQHKYYWELIALWAIILFLIDPFALIYLWLAPAGFAKIFGSLVFSYSHRDGKPHSDFIVGILTFGEGFHTVHHEKPYINLWHPWDIGGRFIRLVDKDAT